MRKTFRNKWKDRFENNCDFFMKMEGKVYLGFDVQIAQDTQLKAIREQLDDVTRPLVSKQFELIIN